MCWDHLIDAEQSDAPQTRHAAPRPMIDVASLVADPVIVPTQDVLPEPIEVGALS